MLLIGGVDFEDVVIVLVKVEVSSALLHIHHVSLGAGILQRKLGEVSRSGWNQPDGASILKLHLGSAIVSGGEPYSLAHWHVHKGRPKTASIAAVNLNFAFNETQPHRADLRLRHSGPRGHKEQYRYESEKDPNNISGSHKCLQFIYLIRCAIVL